MFPLSAGKTPTKTVMTTKSQESMNAPNEDAIASTSSSSADNGQNPLLGTVTVSTSTEETKTATQHYCHWAVTSHSWTKM